MDPLESSSWLCSENTFKTGKPHPQQNMGYQLSHKGSPGALGLALRGRQAKHLAGSFL